MDHAGALVARNDVQRSEVVSELFFGHHQLGHRWTARLVRKLIHCIRLKNHNATATK